MKLCIVTSSRADFGIMSTLIKKIQKTKNIEVDLVVTGSHLDADQGMTVNEIVQQGVNIYEKIEIFDHPGLSTNEYMAVTLQRFDRFFAKNHYDLLLVLGDRFEILSVCIAAVNNKVKIAHIHGGEVTKGSLDNYYRNCITMLSAVHFTSTEVYKNNVVRMIGSNDNVYNVGSLGIENIRLTRLYSKIEIRKLLGFDIGDNYAILTYHSDGYSKSSISDIRTLTRIIKGNTDIEFIITKGNNDAYGKEMNDEFMKETKNLSNAHFYSSLGMKLYFSLVKGTLFVIGNSSSGIIEVPSFSIPTINIGDRQDGRIRSESVLQCAMNYNEINKMIALIKNQKFTHCTNPYEKKKTSDTIIKLLLQFYEGKL